MRHWLRRLDTIRTRAIAGQGALVIGMFVIALIGIAALRTLGNSVSRELATLTRVSETTNTLVITLFDEVRSAEQYLTDRSAPALAAFRTASDRAYELQSSLQSSPQFSQTDRTMVRRLGQLQAEVETWYSLAHAERDLGRRAEADEAALHVRGPSGELLQVIRAFSAVQRSQVEQAATLLETSSRERRLWVWTVLAASILLAGAIGIVEDQRMQIAVAGVEDVDHGQAVTL